MDMISTFDIETIIYDVLNVASLKSIISGDVYKSDDRPLNSDKEDIEINTIALTQEPYPQQGISNINIYVPDMEVSIDGKQQLKANKARLKAISDKVKELILSYRKVCFMIDLENIVKDSDIKQHFVNIRLSYNYYEKTI